MELKKMLIIPLCLSIGFAAVLSGCTGNEPSDEKLVETSAESSAPSKEESSTTSEAVSDENDASSFADITKLRRGYGTPTVYKCFLNIKNPLYFNTLGEFRDYSHKEGHYNDNGDFVSDVILPKEYDGIIVKQRNAKDLSKEFVAPKPNQIKSATDNNGDFSTENDDINYSTLTDIVHPVVSLAQVRDNIIPENRETFERLINTGGIEINC